MAGNFKKKLSDYLDLARTNGIELIGEMPANANTKVLWRCPVGHEWQTTYCNIKSGTNCPTCSNDAKRSYFEIDYRYLAEERGYEFLGPVPQASGYKTHWRCSRGHEWEVSFKGLKGCPYCASNGMKLPQDYNILARKLGFKWVGPNVKNGHTKTNWICNKGHTISTTYNNMLVRGGCYMCMPNCPKNEFDYYALAKNVGIKYIGPFPKTTMRKTGWICKRGHSVQTTYHAVVSGHICRKCYLINNTGSGNCNWRGGPRFPYSDEFDEVLKESIRNRDNNECQVCGRVILDGTRMRSLDVHHIIPARYAPGKIRHKSINLITTCRSDHKKLESDLTHSIPMLRNLLSEKYGYFYTDNPFSYLTNL